jgi:hypothetical protein
MSHWVDFLRPYVYVALVNELFAFFDEKGLCFHNSHRSG